MIMACNSYIWEHGNPKDGIAAYHNYLSATYFNSEDDPNIVVRFSELANDRDSNAEHNSTDSQEFTISSDSTMWSTLGSLGYISEIEDTIPLGTGFGEPSPRGASLAEAMVLQDEHDVAHSDWWRWFNNLNDTDQDILFTWSNVRSWQEVEHYCQVGSAYMKRVWDKAHRAHKRSLAYALKMAG